MSWIYGLIACEGNIGFDIDVRELMNFEELKDMWT